MKEIIKIIKYVFDIPAHCSINKYDIPNIEFLYFFPSYTYIDDGYERSLIRQDIYFYKIQLEENEFKYFAEIFEDGILIEYVEAKESGHPLLEII